MMEYPFKDLLPLDQVLEREGYYNDWTHLDPEVFYSLTQISEYIKTKGYGVDVRLLIAQLAEHFSLKTSQINEIERLFKDVMKELSEDKDYHSLPEIAGARGGFDTLGERLNDTKTRVDDFHNRVDEIITTHPTDGINIEEIKDARQGRVSLGANLRDMKDDLGEHKLDVVHKNTITNLINPDTISDNTGLSSLGVPSPSGAGAKLTAHIPVTSGEKYTFGYVHNAAEVVQLCWYDKNGDRVFIVRSDTSVSEIVRTYEAPENAHTVRYVIFPQAPYNPMIVKGSYYPDAFLEYGEYLLTDLQLKKGSVKNESIDDSEIKPVKLEDIVTNLIDPEKIMPNTSLSSLGEATSTTSGARLTDYIEVVGGEEYTFGYVYTDAEVNQLCWYDKDFSRVQLVKSDPTKDNNIQTFTAPQDGYVRYTLFPQSPYEPMLVRGSQYPEEFIPYGKYIFKNMHVKSSESTTDYDIYKYPLKETWGHEYLYSWYEKLHNDETVTLNLEGDSTTKDGERGEIIEKIMRIGHYDESKITVNSRGFGGRTTGEWVGNHPSGAMTVPSDVDNYPNGILDVSMAMEPDLLIYGYGINDGNNIKYNTTTLEEKLVIFEGNVREALERIRGNTPINGRPSYNRNADDLAIILCTPITTKASWGGTITRDTWTKHTRPILQRLAREFHCGFFDISMHHYDHEFSNAWSTADYVHPNYPAFADFMSGIQDLVYPMGLWKV